jgi:hypothetical protein
LEHVEEGVADVEDLIVSVLSPLQVQLLDLVEMILRHQDRSILPEQFVQIALWLAKFVLHMTSTALSGLDRA